MVKNDKIGTGMYFWCFPSDELNLVCIIYISTSLLWLNLDGSLKVFGNQLNANSTSDNNDNDNYNENYNPNHGQSNIGIAITVIRELKNEKNFAQIEYPFDKR